MSRYLSIYSLGWMSKDVYCDNQTNLFPRIHHKGSRDKGFFGAAYKDFDTVIIAVRGTAERQDGWDDARMVPVISGEAARQAMEKMVAEYIKGYPQSGGAGSTLGAIVQAIFNREVTQIATGSLADAIPKSQADNAIKFTSEVMEICKKEKLKLRGFTGHSLGGALAQFLSEQTGPGGRTQINKPIPAVVFNSPHMGRLQGMRYGEGGGILSVNHRLDPLSYLTREVGNKSHSIKSDYIEILDSKYPLPPPPYTTFSKIPFLKWLGQACLHFHSIDTAIGNLHNSALGRKTLSHFFPQTFNDYWN